MEPAWERGSQPLGTGPGPVPSSPGSGPRTNSQLTLRKRKMVLGASALWFSGPGVPGVAKQSGSTTGITGRDRLNAQRWPQSHLNSQEPSAHWANLGRSLGSTCMRLANWGSPSQQDSSQEKRCCFAGFTRTGPTLPQGRVFQQSPHSLPVAFPDSDVSPLSVCDKTYVL